MSERAIDKARVISELFSQEQEQRDIQSLLMGKRIKEAGREDAVAVAFVERALLGMGEHTLDIGTYQDLYAKSCMILGMNDKSRCSVDDTEWASRKLEELFSLSLGEDKATSLLTGEVCERLLSHMKDPDASPYPEHVNKAMDAFLTTKRRQFLVDRAKENAFEHHYEPTVISDIVEKYGLKKDPEAPTAEQPALSDQTFKQTNVIEMAQQAEKDHLKHKLSEDLQTDALMRLNAILDDHPQLVNRTLVDKLKTFASSQVDKVIDPHHLTYPKESIFSETLAEMDINGRAKKTLLTYRRPLLGGLSVEFDSPYSQRDEDGKPMRPADATFDIAALKLRSEGVKNPHITSRFRDPEAAIMFMQNCVRSLVDAGYNIEDISVGRNLQHAFENIKADFAPVISMGEAPEEALIDPELSPEPKPAPGYHAPREVLPEEQVAQANEAINKKISSLKAVQEDPERPIPDDQLKIEDLVYCMDVAAEVGDLSKESTWQELQSTPGLAPGLSAQVKRVHDYVGRLIDKANPEHETHKPLGPREIEKLLAIGDARLLGSFDHGRLGKAIESIKEQALAYQNANNQDNTRQPDPTPLDNGEQGRSNPNAGMNENPPSTDVNSGREASDRPPAIQPEGEAAGMERFDEYIPLDAYDEAMAEMSSSDEDPGLYDVGDYVGNPPQSEQNIESQGMPRNEQDKIPLDVYLDGEAGNLDAPSQGHHENMTNTELQPDQATLQSAEMNAEPTNAESEEQPGIDLNDEKWVHIANNESWDTISGESLANVVSLVREELDNPQLATFENSEMDIVSLDDLVKNVGSTLQGLVSEEGLVPGEGEHKLIARIDPALLTEQETAALNELNQKEKRALAAAEQKPENTPEPESVKRDSSITRPGR